MPMGLAPAVGDDLAAFALLGDAVDQAVTFVVGDHIDRMLGSRRGLATAVVNGGGEKAGEQRRRMLGQIERSNFVCCNIMARPQQMRTPRRLGRAYRFRPAR